MSKQVRTFVGVVVLLFAFGFLIGCGQKKVETSQTPTVVDQASPGGLPTTPQTPNSSPTPIAEAASNPSSKPSVSPTLSKPPTESTVHEAAPEPVIDSTPSSLIPILIGEDFNGVMAAMGREPDETFYGYDYSDYRGWTYRNYTSNHSLHFMFDREDKRVKSAMWFFSNGLKQELRYSNPTKPENIIPKDIWDSDPEGIYMSNENTIVVYWKYNHDSYLAQLADSKRTLIVVTTGMNDDGLKYSKTSLAQEAQDFRACDNLIAFAYVKGYKRFFYEHPGFGISGELIFSYDKEIVFYPE